MGHPISNFPVALFPLKLETRFIGDELWIRAYPDKIFLQSHDPRLTKEEQKDAIHFKQLTNNDQKRKNWEKLVAKYGVYRSAYLVHISRKTEVSTIDEKLENQEPEFSFQWLPDRLVAYLYRKDENEPAYKKIGLKIDRAGLTVLGEGDEWIEDFEKSVEDGMSLKIKLNDPVNDTEFEKVIVTGIRYAEDPIVPARGLTELFNNHQYTEGFSFLNYGTPTNNTEQLKSGHSVRDEFDASNSFEYVVNGLNLENNVSNIPDFEFSLPTAGRYLAKNLGLETTDFQHVKRADHIDPKLNHLFQKATWFALGAEPIFMLFGDQMSSETHEWLWHHYSKYVKARGLNSSIKIGNQPYGILPVMSIRSIFNEENITNSRNVFDKMVLLLARLFEHWILMAKDDHTIPQLREGSDISAEILKILSMQEYSISYQIRSQTYSYFPGRLKNWLQKITEDESLDRLLEKLHSNLKTEYDNIKENIESLLIIFEGFPIDKSKLLFTPLIHFQDTQTLLMRFQEDEFSFIDNMGKEISNEDEVEKAPIEFEQEDFRDFESFIQHLETPDESALFQYTGKLSLFTDLFISSYANASQLYHREIFFEPGFEDLKGFESYKVANILVAPGATVTKGDVVLEIGGKEKENWEPRQNIAITAPFDGKIEVINVEQGAVIRPGKTLFRLKNKEKGDGLKKEFIDLGNEIIKECRAISNPEELKKAQMDALRETIDLNSYRLDAWITSLAVQRIEALRNVPRYEKGIYFGFYGWAENLSKDKHIVNDEMEDVYKENGGIIHAPDSAKAVASAIFKNSFLTNRNGNEESSKRNPFILNLTSDRIQKSHFLLEGVRQGQSIEALLGYQLERYLHEHEGGGLKDAIYTLREVFPLDENIRLINGQTSIKTELSVIDGLKAINHKDKLTDIPDDQLNGAQKDQVKIYLNKLEDNLDGVLDTLFFEAGYQITQGNLSQASAALDATKGAIEPPKTESLKTRTPGVGLSHKLALIFSDPKPQYIENFKGFVEPVLERWLIEKLGDFKKIGCVVEIYHSDDENANDSANVKLSDLNIGYLDFLYLSESPVSEGASELELQIWSFARKLKNISCEETIYKITQEAPQDCQPLGEALEVARYAYNFLSKCRYLKSEDITMAEETIDYPWDALESIKNERLIPVLEKLKSFRQNSSIKEKINILTKFDLQHAKTALLEGMEIDLEKLKGEINQKINQTEQYLSKYNRDLPYERAFEYLNQAAKTLFGKQFILIPPAIGSDKFSQVIKSNQQHLLIGDKASSRGDQVWGQERIQHWVQGLAQVKENTEAFEDWQMVNKAWSESMSLKQNSSYYIVQSPTLLQYPWVGLSKEEINTLLQEHFQDGEAYISPELGKPYPLEGDQYYPEGCESMVIYASQDLSFEQGGKIIPKYGVIIGEITEYIPDEKVNTGISFHYNAPNNEPPQAILLAVHPKSHLEREFFWSEDDLKDIIYDTMDLYKIRMVDLEAIQEFGYILPFTNWFNIPRMG